MNPRKKLFLLSGVSALFFSLGLGSCAPAGKNPHATTPMLTIGENGTTNYTVIYPDNVTPILWNAVKDFQTALGNKLGTVPECQSDFVNTKIGEAIPVGTREILVGHTNRPESAEAIKSLSDNEFVIQIMGERIVIAATNDVLLVQALRYFTDTCISVEADTVAVPADLHFVSPSLKVDDAVAENADGTVTLHLKHFCVTYNKSNKQTYVPDVANAFATYASKKFDLLGCIEDNYENEYEILLGKCKRDAYRTTDKKFNFRDFYLHFADNKLSVSASSIYGYEAAIRYIREHNGVITIPADGLYQEYDYGTGPLAEIRKNFENPTLPGAWMVSICHRGDSTTNNYPENSIPAYESCVQLGIDIIETDLSKTADGVWVICHDSSIDRTTTGTGNISSMRYDQIQKYNLLERNGGADAPETEYKMPTLTEIIELCKGKVVLNLDKLQPATYQEVYDIFEENDAVNLMLYKGEWLAGPLTEWFCQLLEKGRELPLYSPLSYSEARIAQSGSYAGLTSMIETGTNLNENTTGALLNSGIRCMCLTALNPSAENAGNWSSLEKRGYTAIMTDSPVQLRKFITGK